MRRKIKYKSDPIFVVQTFRAHQNKGLHFRNAYGFDMARGMNRQGKGNSWGKGENFEYNFKHGQRLFTEKNRFVRVHIV